MKQDATRALFEYWDALRGTRPAPERSDIEPGAIRSCLANTFVLALDPEQGHPFRIAGTEVCALFGSELTRKPFETLWGIDDQRAIRDLLQRVTEDMEGVVAGVTGRNEAAETVGIEMILLPLAGSDGAAGRVLGGLTVAAPPYWLGTRPVQSLQLGDLRFTNAAGAATTIPGRDAPLRGRGFVFYPAAASRISRFFQG
jgi:hypothetical protein